MGALPRWGFSLHEVYILRTIGDVDAFETREEGDDGERV